MTDKTAEVDSTKAAKPGTTLSITFTNVFTNVAQATQLADRATRQNPTAKIEIVNDVTVVISLANLESANLESANLESANLESANLESANLESANLKSANLKSANLKSANLEWANLKSANLEWANLEWANLKSANLKSANLKSANLKSANLKSAKNVAALYIPGASSRGAYLYGVRYDKTLMIFAGCFGGTDDEFEARVKAEKGDGHIYLDMLALLRKWHQS